MADGRMLKKKISLSRKLAALKTDSARMLYSWLNSHLDVEGRFSADPDVVKGQVVPRLKHLTSKIVEELLTDLASKTLIIRYENDGDRFLQLSRFKDEQHLRPDREKDSEIPAPEESNIIDGLHELPGSLPADSRQPPPQVKLREVKLREDICSKLFKGFWKTYPRKVAKQDAEKAFSKINPDEQLLEIMLSKIEQAKKSENWLKNNGQFIPYPASWLNAERWEDEEIGQGEEISQSQHPPYHERWVAPK